MSTQTRSLLPQVIARAIHEPEFRCQLIAHPKATLQAMSVPIPAEQAVTVVESREKQVFFVIPILSDQLIAHLQASLSTVHPQRSVRSQILIKAAQDPDYKADLINRPKTVLTNAGMPIPESAELTVLENSDQHLYIVLPQVHTHKH